MKNYGETLRHDNQVLNLVDGPVRVLTLWFDKKRDASTARTVLGEERNVVFTRVFFEPRSSLGPFRVIAWRAF